MGAALDPPRDPSDESADAQPDAEPKAQNAPPAAPDESTVVVAEPGPESASSAAGRPWLERLRGSLAGRLTAWRLPPPVLAAGALGLAGLGGVCMAIDHYGLGAVFGLLSVAGSWLATAPEPDPAGAAGRPPSGFVRILAHTSVPLLLGGAVMEAAASSAPARAALGTWTLAVLLLLPLTRAVARPGGLAPRLVLWTFAERLVAILAGFLLGHPSLALFLVACVGSADLLLRLAVLRPVPADQPTLPPALKDLFAADGGPQPGVRLACRLALAVVILLYVVLGPSDGWRF